MIVWKAVQDFIQVLKLIPESVIPPDRIGVKRPSRIQDLPAVVVAIGEVEESPIGIGGLVKTHRVSENQWIEARGKKASGILLIEIWASSEEVMNEVASAVFQTIEASEKLIRGMGFIRFSNREVRPMEDVLGMIRAVRMVIGYSIVYEEIKADTVGPGGIIKQVHVEIGDEFNEEMDLR